MADFIFTSKQTFDFAAVGVVPGCNPLNRGYSTFSVRLIVVGEMYEVGVYGVPGFLLFTLVIKNGWMKIGGHRVPYCTKHRSLFLFSIPPLYQVML